MNTKKSEEKALRYNEGKPQWSLIDFDTLIPLVRAMEYGASKYGAWNWKKGHPVTKAAESLMRHMFALLRGEDVDPESGVEHIGHVMSNAMFISNTLHNKPELDDRRHKLSEEKDG